LSETKPNLAKINRKLMQRTAIFVAILAAVIYGAYWLLTKKDDPDSLFGPAKTVGDLAAVEAMSNGGYEVVIVKPDNTIINANDSENKPDTKFADGSDDENPTWRPDGGRVFFESDRYQQEPHLFRWDPDRNVVDRRSTDKRPKGFISFATPGVTSPADQAKGLMISGGTVVELNAGTGAQIQLLPPAINNNATAEGSENGSQSAMELYATYGNSFAKAFWTKDKKAIVAVMNREGGDQALIIQDMTKPNTHPQGFLMGRHIGLDVGPVSGRIVFSVQGWEIPDWYTEEQKKPYIKNGKLVPPFWGLVEVLDLENKDFEDPTKTTSGVMIQSAGPQEAFGDPAISPDESLVALPAGNMTSGDFKATGLIAMPPKPRAAAQAFAVAPGDFSHLSWMPDSSQIVAIFKSGNQSDIATVEPKPNGLFKNVTQGRGIFTDVAASPQK
jgi:hypothetical protein